MILPTIEIFYKKLGERIKSERIKRNISQEKLAEFIELTRASIINLEKGRHRPSIYQVIMIANFFELDYQILIPFETQKQAKSNNRDFAKEITNVVTDQQIDKSSKKVINSFLFAIKKNEE